MSFLRKIFLDAFLPAILLIGIVYNGLVAVNGPQGLRVLKQLKAEKVERLALLQAERARTESLTHRAEMLSLRSMNHDLLDETARRVLGFAQPNEFVITEQELERYLREFSTPKSSAYKSP